MWELLQTIQPEVEMFWGNLSQQTLIKLSGHVMITLKKKWGEGEMEGHDEILTLELVDVAAKREIQTLDKVLAIIPHII